MKKSLEKSEWFLIATFLSLFIASFAVAKITAYRAGSALDEVEIEEEVFDPAVVTVIVRGAVEEPLEVALPKGARISDLKSKVALKKDADKAFFKRRRLLKNGEIVLVPKKSVE
ncbi:MAG: hypothetical protein A3E80_01870 [Chlamydiae bacterium RIFCSPHIGHO2_12_FULL_49_9]|nr:MAG: hypothetical protein A3E80_01870 [Chlamydiae bacterium RIFCSPHIGHO2_12_FULL_49_9]